MICFGKSDNLNVALQPGSREIKHWSQKLANNSSLDGCKIEQTIAAYENISKQLCNFFQPRFPELKP